MKPSRSKLLTSALKTFIFALCFVAIQYQIEIIRTDVHGASGKAAHAIGAVDRTREELVVAVESSQRDLQDVQQNVRVSEDTLRTQKETLTSLLANRDREISSTFDMEFSRYKGQLEQVASRSEETAARVRTVERKMGKNLTPNSRWLEKRILYPIAQLKGDGTVGSGVLVYSKLERTTEKGFDGSGNPVAASSKPAGDSYRSYLITACHVAMEILGSRFPRGEIENIRLLDPDAPETLISHSATVEIYDEARDLALLKLSTKERLLHVAHRINDAGFRDLKLFSRVYAVGCPLGNNPMPTCGEISSTSKVVGDQEFWMINAPTFFGNSGGGVFLSETCELIGISSMIYTYGKSKPVVVPHMGLFVPISDVVKWLESEGYDYVFESDASARKNSEKAVAH